MYDNHIIDIIFSRKLYLDLIKKKDYLQQKGIYSRDHYPIERHKANYQTQLHYKSHLVTYMAKGQEDDLATTKNIINMLFNYRCSLIGTITTTPVYEMVCKVFAAGSNLVISVNETRYAVIVMMAAPKCL